MFTCSRRSCRRTLRLLVFKGPCFKVGINEVFEGKTSLLPLHFILFFYFFALWNHINKLFSVTQNLSNLNIFKKITVAILGTLRRSAQGTRHCNICRFHFFDMTARCLFFSQNASEHIPTIIEVTARFWQGIYEMQCYQHKRLCFSLTHCILATYTVVNKKRGCHEDKKENLRSIHWLGPSCLSNMVHAM